MIQFSPDIDFADLEATITGTGGEKLHLVEIGIDVPVWRHIAMKYMNMTGGNGASDLGFYRTRASVYYHLGYDTVPFWPHFTGFDAPAPMTTTDTAPKPKGERSWLPADGLIHDRDDFKAFPWHEAWYNIDPLTWALDEYGASPCKEVICTTLYEYVSQRLIGLPRFYDMIAGDADLVADIFDRWGTIVYHFYNEALSKHGHMIGAICHADDVGHKDGTLVSPDILRDIWLPWLKRYADLAHKHGKMFWLHSCGNTLALMDDFIKEVGIDAYHSFDDNIIPVVDFMDRYDVGVLGGVDMNKLCTLPPTELRQYIRPIIEKGLRRGRYVFGSGNSIANYVPIENYFVMLDTAREYA